MSDAPATAHTPAGRTGTRLHGVDVARGLAIAGMLTRHVGPTPTDPAVASAAWFYTRTDGRAAVLFALVAGVGVALLADRHPLRWLGGRMLYRAVWLLPLGLWLQTLDHPVAVILQFYALYFVAVLPFVRRTDATLLASAAGMAMIGPALVLAVRVRRPEWVSHLGGDPPNLAVDLLVAGHYPLVTYLVPVLVGLWLGRRALAWRAAGRPAGPLLTIATVGAGTAVAVAVTSVLLAGAVTPDPRAVSWIASVDGHSQMPLWVVAATGSAMAVVALSLLVADRAPRLLWPAAAFGRLALTVYVGHLLAFDRLPARVLAADTVAGGVGRVAAIVVLGTALALAWLALHPRGPLEELERLPFAVLLDRRLRRWSAGRGPLSP